MVIIDGVIQMRGGAFIHSITQEQFYDCCCFDCDDGYYHDEFFDTITGGDGNITEGTDWVFMSGPGTHTGVLTIGPLNVCFEEAGTYNLPVTRNMLSASGSAASVTTSYNYADIIVSALGEAVEDGDEYPVGDGGSAIAVTIPEPGVYKITFQAEWQAVVTVLGSGDETHHQYTFWIQITGNMS